MNLTFPVDKLVAYLETVTDITDIVGQEIYYGKPFEFQTDGITIIGGLVSQTPDELYKRARIELRFIANSESITKKELIDVQNIVVEYLCYQECLGQKNFDGFTVFNTVEGGQLVELIDNNNRNILVKDFIIYFNT